MNLFTSVTNTLQQFQPYLKILMKVKFHYFPLQIELYRIGNTLQGVTDCYLCHRDKLTEYLPVSACKVGWSLPGRRSATRNTLEQQLLDKYKEVSSRSLELRQLYRSYLEKCWTFPFYGYVCL